MKKLSHIILLCITAVPALTVSAEEATGLRGDPAAIADARAMVEAMGGLAIWRDTASVHFVHEWDFVNRPDPYLEHEILDLTGPRSYVTMDSEIYSRTRAYSPEHGRWSITNGEFARDGEPHGWIIVNARKEPIIWATTQYVYVFGPLKRFGNLKVPNWATTNDGLVRYEMVSLTGSPQRPALSLFAAPE